MRPLIILLLLICAGCHSRREAISDTAISRHIDRLDDSTLIGASQILAMVTSSATVHLAGVTVEFYPPDTTVPATTPRPRALKIDSLDLQRSTRSSSLESELSVGSSTKSRQEDASAENHSAKSTSTRALTFPPWYILAAVILILTVLFLRLRLRS